MDVKDEVESLSEEGQAAINAEPKEAANETTSILEAMKQKDGLQLEYQKEVKKQ